MDVADGRAPRIGCAGQPAGGGGFEIAMSKRRRFSDDERAAYRRDGIARVRGLFDGGAMKQITVWVDEVTIDRHRPIGRYLADARSGRVRSRYDRSVVDRANGDMNDGVSGDAGVIHNLIGE